MHPTDPHHDHAKRTDPNCAGRTFVPRRAGTAQALRDRHGAPPAARGGQHRNKVETQVFVRYKPADVEARADERRSQSENKSVASAASGFCWRSTSERPPVGEIGSGLFRSRVRNGRIACNPEHDDYPAMLAEALDVIAAARWDVAKPRSGSGAPRAS